MEPLPGSGADDALRELVQGQRAGGDAGIDHDPAAQRGTGASHQLQDRATFDAERRLVRLERIEGGRLVEFVAREGVGTGAEKVRYENTRARRVLSLEVTRTLQETGFDASIWRR